VGTTDTTGNSNTSPSGNGFSSGTTAVVPGGTVYTNTTDAAASAVSQESLGVLRDIAANTGRTADNTAPIKATSESADFGAVNLRNTLATLQNAPDAAVTAATAAAQRGHDSAAAALATAFGDGTTAAPPPVPAVEEPSVQLQVTPTQTVTLWLNPFSTHGPFGGVMKTAAGFIRGLIAWGLVAAFFIWCLGKIRGMIATPFATAPFGNAIAEAVNSIKIAGFGGGIGWVVKIAAYALVLTVVLTMPLAVMALMTSHLPFTDLLALFHSGPGGPGSGMVGQAVALADQVVPWAMLLAAPVWFFTVEFLLFPSQFFWMVFIKFLPI